MKAPRLLAWALATGLLAGCISAGASRTASERATAGAPAPGATVTPSAGSSPSLAPSMTAPSPSPTPSPGPLPHRFAATVSRLPAELVREMHGTTWRSGCPVPLSALRLLTLRTWGFDGQVHEGPLVVNAAVAGDVVEVFRELFRVRFPIKDLHLAPRYRPNHDDPSDRRDYTAAFNCRPVVTPAGPGSSWSQHAYGLAIDIDPMENPYVASNGFVRNRFARAYRDRSQDLPGMIHEGDAVVRAFAAIGWGWGGHWSSGKDYMHFSASGT